MRIAETVGSRTLIVISAMGLAGAIAAAIVTASTQPEPVARSRGQLRPMRGCVERVAAPPPVVNVKPPTPAARTHSEQIQLLRRELDRCVDGPIDGTLAIMIRRDGSIRELKLDGNLGARPDAFKACMNAVVRPVMFPPSDTEMRVEMLIAKD